MIQQILDEARQKNCSDVHISAGYKIILRLDGDLVDYKDPKIMSQDEVYNLLYSIMSEQQKNYFLENREIDFSIESNEKFRCRVNAYHTILGPAAAFRLIPKDIRSLVSLNAPYVVQDLAKLKKGLIMVAGPTGSGKSTTLAGIIDYINHNYMRHIITIEDPVEYMFENKRSLINQRELGSSTNSFNEALKSSLRQDPDVIMVGEMRDLETFRLALTAAETGHLVLATLHTNSAAQTINRIIDVFPAEEKSAVRSILSGSIKAVISQRLVKKRDGGRCAAFEIMLANSSIRNLIREDKIPQINSIIELSRKNGMLLLKDSLKDLMNNDIITQEIAEEELLSYES
jgi:twitching motility protein PilT